MALTVQYATNPTIATNAGTLTPGLASEFRGRINGYVGTVEDHAQLAQAHVEQLTRYIGNGCILGGSLAAGSGLSVTHGTLAAMVGNIVELDASGTISGLTASATNYIYLRQDGTWTANTTGVVPGTVDGHGTALLWGQATCGTASVTVVSNTRALVPAYLGMTKHCPFAWHKDDCAAGTAAVVMTHRSGVYAQYEIPMRAGHVTALQIVTSAAGTAGTLTATLYIGGTAQGMAAQLTSGVARAISYAQIGDYPFAAGALVDVRLTTSADWAPTTTDVRADIEWYW